MICTRLRIISVFAQVLYTVILFFQLQGGFGSVFGIELTQQNKRQNNTKLAVKVINKKAVENVIYLTRNEIQTHQQLNHRHIVQLIHSFDDDKNFFLFLSREELSLRQILNQKLFIPISDCRQYIAQLLEGVKYLHKKGILHRDLKPSNILLNGNIVKIADFGLAVHESEAAEKRSICGTEPYLAPEVINGMGFSTASDIWAIAVTSFELMHQYRPFDFDLNMPLQDRISAFFQSRTCFDEDPEFLHFIRSIFECNLKVRPTAEECLRMPFIQDRHPNNSKF